METEDDIQVLLNFLKKPLNRHYFNAFFKLCYQLVIGHLSYLNAKHYQIPVEISLDRRSLSDLTIDILGSFLRSTKDQPFIVIFDYFQKQGVSDFNESDSHELFGQFRSLLLTFIKGELGRIRKDKDPQLDHLKRRIKDILKEPEFITFLAKDNHTKHVCHAGSKSSDRDDRPHISYKQLLALVEDAFYLSNNRKEWCRNVFKSICAMTGVQDCLKKHELISAMISVNMKYFEIDPLLPSKLPGAEYQIYAKTIEDAKQQSLLWLDDSLLKRFVRKGRITKEHSRHFIVAVDRYLADLCYSSSVDLLPVYFREVMPESEHPRYLKDYKYVFETSVYKTEEYFKNLLKDSINPNYGDYINK